jgi:hypothetical protein
MEASKVATSITMTSGWTFVAPKTFQDIQSTDLTDHST